MLGAPSGDRKEPGRSQDICPQGAHCLVGDTNPRLAVAGRMTGAVGEGAQGTGAYPRRVAGVLSGQRKEGVYSLPLIARTNYTNSVA